MTSTEAEVEAAARAIRVAQASEPDGQRRLGQGWDTYLVNNEEAEVLMRQARHSLTAVEPLIRERLAQEVGSLHRPRTEQFVTGDCASEDCDHEDDCPTTPIEVCHECWSIAEEVHGIYWAEGNGPKEVVIWPCATARIVRGDAS